MRRWIRRLLALAATAVVAAVLVFVGWRVARPAQLPFPPLPPPPPGAPPVAGERPNLVLVIACTLRADQLTPYGAPAQTSPFLAELAGRGVRFADAIDAAPWTRAASTAVLTGHHPIEVGMVEPEPTVSRRRLSAAATTLAELLHDGGYETLGLTANPNLNRVFGFDQGYDAYFEGQELWSEGGERPKPRIEDLTDQALRMIDARARPEAPLYLRLVTLDTHEPLEVRPKGARAQAEEGLPPRIAKYRAAVRRWDDGLRRLEEGLRARGYTDDNTVLVVVNDHGEGLMWPPEYGPGHGNFPAPAVVRMPWVVAGAGVAKGQVVDGLASQVDVAPTLLGLAGVGGYQGPGRDWSGLLRGEGASTGVDRAYSETWFYRANRAAIYTRDRVCVHDFENVAEQQGLERRLPKTACYDRLADPLAREPLPELDRSLLDDLLRWREAGRAAYDAWPAHETIGDDDPVVQQLEALGYAEGEQGIPKR